MVLGDKPLLFTPPDSNSYVHSRMTSVREIVSIAGAEKVGLKYDFNQFLYFDLLICDSMEESHSVDISSKV